MNYYDPSGYSKKANNCDSKDVNEGTVNRNKLNLGAGDNIVDDAINVDIRQLDGIDVVADANKLPFDAGYFDEVVIQNPYGYDVLDSDVARVMNSGGELSIVGGQKNKYFMEIYNAGDDVLSSYGYELISKGTASDEFMFGIQKTTNGIPFSDKALQNQLEIILRRK